MSEGDLHKKKIERGEENEVIYRIKEECVEIIYLKG
jgi:hypothetical protein